MLQRLDSIIVSLYIDPGTGAMLFSVLMGIVSAGFFLMQKIWHKVKFIINGGLAGKEEKNSVPYVIFSDSKRYWNVFKPVCDEFEARKIQCEYWTASSDDPALQENYEYVKCFFIGSRNKPYAKLNMMNADICLATTPGLDVYQWKRSKNCSYYVHILHDVGEVVFYRMFGIDYYDAILTSGSFQECDIRTLEDMRGTKVKDVRVIGSTYMDSLKEKYDKYAYRHEGRPVVLLASSWGESSILSRFKGKIIKALIETGYDIVVRPHPQSLIVEKNMIEKLQKEFEGQISWNFDNDNFDILNKSDIMITDFSSVIFDYSLIFDKAVIYADTHMDYSPYDACWLGDDIWRKKVLPQLGIELKEEDFGDLKYIIDKAMKDDIYSSGRKYVRQQAWNCKGKAAQNVVDYLVEKHKELLGEAN